MLPDSFEEWVDGRLCDMGNTLGGKGPQARNCRRFCDQQLKVPQVVVIKAGTCKTLLHNSQGGHLHHREPPSCHTLINFQQRTSSYMPPR
jgi:hypothetical protein